MHPIRTIQALAIAALTLAPASLLANPIDYDESLDGDALASPPLAVGAVSPGLNIIRGSINATVTPVELGGSIFYLPAGDTGDELEFIIDQRTCFDTFEIEISNYAVSGGAQATTTASASNILLGAITGNGIIDGLFDGPHELTAGTYTIGILALPNLVAGASVSFDYEIRIGTACCGGFDESIFGDIEQSAGGDLGILCDAVTTVSGSGSRNDADGIRFTVPRSSTLQKIRVECDLSPDFVIDIASVTFYGPGLNPLTFERSGSGLMLDTEGCGLGPGTYQIYASSTSVVPPETAPFTYEISIETAPRFTHDEQLDGPIEDAILPPLCVGTNTATGHLSGELEFRPEGLFLVGDVTDRITLDIPRGVKLAQITASAIAAAGDGRLTVAGQLAGFTVGADADMPLSIIGPATVPVEVRLISGGITARPRSMDWMLTIDTESVCPCESTDNTAVAIDDLLAFLALWFALDPDADYNGGGIDVTDLLDFMTCWFSASSTGQCD